MIFIISSLSISLADGSVSEQLKWARSQIISNAACKIIYGGHVVTNGTICISTENRVSTCLGDSGGPLVLEDSCQLIGVTSFVSAMGCTNGNPSGFARITYYRDWIYDITKI